MIGVPATRVNSLLPPSLRMIERACFSALPSTQVMLLCSTLPHWSMGMMPIACVEKTMPLTSSGLMPASSTTARVDLQTASQYSAGSCSTKLGLG